MEQKTFIKPTELKSIDKINTQIYVFQLSRNPNILNKLIKIITPYIYHFPRFAFNNHDEEICSEFYTSFYPKIENTLLKYDTNRVLFSTYFSTVLRNHYLTLIKRYHQKNKNHIRLEDSHLDFKLKQEPKEPIQENKSLEEQVFQNMSPPINYLMIKLYYIDFFNENDFILFKQTTQKTYGECLEFINLIKKNIYEKRNKQMGLENRIHNLYMKIMEIQRENFIKQNSNISKEKDQEEDKLKEKQKEIIKTYQNIRAYPSLKIIAEALNCKETKIANTINYFKIKRKTYLNDL